MNKNNSYIWITGASSGIGKALALEFTANDLPVIASARRKESLQRVKKEVDQQKKGRIELLPLDVKNYEEVESAVKKLTEEDSINCLINNAGATSFKLANENSIEEIKEIIDTNLYGSIHTIKAVLPHMIEKKKGTIINILSVAVEKVLTQSSVYAASKAGLRAYAKVLREEVREHNIRVINILPGATRTPIWPNSTLEKFGERMMSPVELAKLVYNAYSVQSNLVTEELQIRPIKGDL